MNRYLIILSIFAVLISYGVTSTHSIIHTEHSNEELHCAEHGYSEHNEEESECSLCELGVANLDYIKSTPPQNVSNVTTLFNNPLELHNGLIKSYLNRHSSPRAPPFV